MISLFISAISCTTLGVGGAGWATVLVCWLALSSPIGGVMDSLPGLYCLCVLLEYGIPLPTLSGLVWWAGFLLSLLRLSWLLSSLYLPLSWLLSSLFLHRLSPLSSLSSVSFSVSSSSCFWIAQVFIFEFLSVLKSLFVLCDIVGSFFH